MRYGANVLLNHENGFVYCDADCLTATSKFDQVSNGFVLTMEAKRSLT